MPSNCSPCSSSLNGSCFADLCTPEANKNKTTSSKQNPVAIVSLARVTALTHASYDLFMQSVANSFLALHQFVSLSCLAAFGPGVQAKSVQFVACRGGYDVLDVDTNCTVAEGHMVFKFMSAGTADMCAVQKRPGGEVRRAAAATAPAAASLTNTLWLPSQPRLLRRFRLGGRFFDY